VLVGRSLANARGSENYRGSENRRCSEHRNFIKYALGGLVCLLLCSAAFAQTATPDLEDVIKRVREDLRPDQAIQYMRRVYATDRFFTFPQFHKTAEYLKTEMQTLGLREATIVDAPADGTTQVGFWTMPMAWDVKSATLELLDDSVPAATRTLADYKKIPSSLGMWSGPTSADGIVAEVVEPGSDVRGKLVLTSQNPANIKWQLVEAGALGAINAFTENPKLQDGRQWINAWGDDGWAFTKRSTPLLCFSITPRQATLIRGLLKRGPVRVKASVDSQYFSGTYPYVTSVLPGTGPEEVLTLGHTSEQGAQDNATGVAATLEAMGTLQRLISEGKLARPRRSIRILSMGEMYGSMHYVANNRERVRHTVAAICVDTPAASYDLAGTEYTFYMNPHVAKDFTDALILKIAADYFPLVRRPWHERPFTTGTDTYLAEPMVGIPTVWGYSGSGVETHHNSEDTPDRVDSRSLRDISTVVAAYLYFIANADANDALWLAGLSESRGYQQILKAADERRTAEQVNYAMDRESQSVLSVLRLVSAPERDAVRLKLQPMLDRLQQFGQLQLSRVPAAKSVAEDAEAAKIIVKRKRFGTIPLDDLPHREWEGQPSGAWAAIPTIALYWCDGRRSLAEVAKLTKLELGPTKFDFVSYFRFLRKHGYVDFVQNDKRSEN
jgi:hypothetical protein